MTVVSDYTALLAINDSTYTRWNNITDLATPVIVTYSFADGANVPTISESSHSVYGTAAFTETQRFYFRQITEIFEANAGVVFVEVEEGGMVDISNASGSSFGGWAAYPSSSNYSTGEGILVITSSGDYNPGSYAYLTMLHELGHAMGLQHPHEGSVTLSSFYDSLTYTVMTYNNNTPFSTTLGSFDVQALRHLYGNAVDTSGWVTSYDNVNLVLTVEGGALDDTILGVAGENDLSGGKGADTLFGREDDDTLAGQGGQDYLVGMRGDDTIFGNKGDDTLFGSGGDDHLFGGAGSDALYGGRFGDTLVGGKGRDTLDGGSGYDHLFGGRGRDTLTGAADRDTFHFDNKSGKDRITDFEDGIDRIDIRDGSYGFDDLKFRARNSGADTVIKVDGYNVSIYLEDVTKVELSSYDFYL